MPSAPPGHIETHQCVQSGNLGGLQGSATTPTQVSRAQSGKHGAFELEDRMANRLAHASHLPVASFVNGHLKPCLCSLVSIPSSQNSDGGRGGGSIRQLDASAQRFEGRRGRRAVDEGFVCLLDFESRVGEAIGELTVVGEKEHARRVSIESTHRHSGVTEFTNMVKDSPPAAGITPRYQQALWFVEKDIFEGIGKAYNSAVKVDSVGLRADCPAGGEDRLTINLHGAGFDELVTLAPRGDSRSGEEAIQSQLTCIPCQRHRADRPYSASGSALLLSSSTSRRSARADPSLSEAAALKSDKGWVDSASSWTGSSPSTRAFSSVVLGAPKSP